MKLSKKGEYALMAMIVLSMHYGKDTLQTKEIAEQENIPVKFLEQILLELKKAGILESKRGSRGGYRMIKDPKDVSLAYVIRIIDGPLAPINCVSRMAHVKCPKEKTCGLYKTMLDVRNAISDILEGVSFQDIIDRYE